MMSLHDDSREADQTRDSTRLLRVAIATTAIAAALYVAFLAISMVTLFGPAPSPERTAMTERPLKIAMVRLVGGRAAWPHYVEALDHLGAELDRPVSTMFLQDGERAEAAFEAHTDLDGAFMSIYAYLLARESEPGLTRLVSPIINGHERERAVLVVAAESDYRQVEDLRGGRAALAPPGVGGSLAGNGYARLLLDERGLGSAEHFFSTVEVGGSQEANLRRVKAGLADVTSVNRTQLASWPPGTFRVIARSQEYGMPPFVLSPRLSDGEADAIIGALLSFRPAGEVGDDSLERFVTADPDDYEFPLVLLSYVHPERREPFVVEGR
jgi:ABC-type phosphate/phosphonate transport system substrate-binding protein